MQSTCDNCGWCDKQGYASLRQTEHLGFCNRFKEVVNRTDTNCVGFTPDKQKEEHFRNLAKAKQLNINLQQKLDLWENSSEPF